MSNKIIAEMRRVLPFVREQLPEKVRVRDYWQNMTEEEFQAYTCSLLDEHGLPTCHVPHSRESELEHAQRALDGAQQWISDAEEILTLWDRLKGGDAK